MIAHFYANARQGVPEKMESTQVEVGFGSGGKSEKPPEGGFSN
jgi:hypothetical protein